MSTARTNLACLAAGALLASTSAARGILDDVAAPTAQLQATAFSLQACAATWDGTSYWGAKAGTTSATTLCQWDENGTLLNTWSTGIDHRALFMDGANNLVCVDYGGGGTDVLQYDASGVPTKLYSLSPSPVDSQMEFGYRKSNNRLYGHSGGVIYDYDFTTGAAIGSFPLIGFGSGTSYPSNVQLAVVDDPVHGELLMTYDQQGRVQAFDFNGNELGSSRVGLTAFDQTFSFSVANGLVWIETATGQLWQGYDVGLSEGTLSGDVDQISLSTGGQQVLAMAVDATFALKTYQVLGTFSGSVPGFVYTGTLIPLNPDAYSIFTLLNPNTPPLLNSAGLLDSLGKATAVFQVPPLSDPGLAGLTAEHVGVVIELIGPNLVVTTATVAVPCLLVP